MQFYLNGYKPGDPDILSAPAAIAQRPAALPELVDVLIVGSGPAGTLLAAQLSTFPGIHTRLVERRSGPLELKLKLPAAAYKLQLSIKKHPLFGEVKSLWQ